MTDFAEQGDGVGGLAAVDETSQRLVDQFAQLVTQRVEQLANGPDRQRIVTLAKRALREARATLSAGNSVAHGRLPAARLKAAEVIAQEWVNLSPASLYRAAESGRFYCVTPNGRSIGKEFPAWQFVEPVPELIGPVLARFAGHPGSGIHAFWVNAADELNELSPAEVLAGKPFDTRGALHASQQELLDLSAVMRARRVQAAASYYLGGPAEIIG